jgi:hypothetical protein
VSVAGAAAALLGGGAGGATPAFVFRPSAVINLAGQSYTSAQAALVRLTVSLSFSGAHDTVQLAVWPDSKLGAPSPGDALAVAIGDAGSEADVWSGEVSAVQASADGTVVDALAATVALSRTRTSQMYLSQSIGDIVNDLASAITIDTVDADTQLEAYAVDDRRSVWSHLIDLARIAGADLGAAASGGLRFVPPKTGASSLTLRHGAEIIAWSGGALRAPDAPTIAAYGAASEAGADKWHWLLNSPSPSGSGAGPMLVVPGVRSRDAADGMAQALGDRAGRAATRGRLVVTGTPAVRPGDLVDATDLPSGDLGTLRVLAVDHVLDAYAGFVTALAVEGAGS